ncbi:MAG: sarcosine oxidase subunit gamma [Euzebya sp.]
MADSQPAEFQTADFDPVARSPIPVFGTTVVRDGWEVSQTPVHGDLRLADLTPWSKWLVHEPGDTGIDPVAMGRCTRVSASKAALAYCTAPGETMLLGHTPPDPGDTAVDMTHVRAVLRLSGDAAAQVLAKVCGLDLSDAMFATGSAGRTLVAHIAAEVVRDDDEGPSYLLVVSRSFAEHLHQVVLEAGQEFGITQVADQPL